MIDSKQLGLKQFIIYEFSTSGSNKGTLFSKALHGKRSWYYKGREKIEKSYPGFIDRKSIIAIGKGALLVRKDKQKDVEESFHTFGIDYKIVRIIYS